jgi:GNAT superfamily N-acetyltransferase
LTELTVRRMRADDLTDASQLMRELGYTIDADELRARTAQILRRDEHALMVAETANGRVAGLVHIFVRAALEKPVEAIVQSLVVDENLRGLGIGARLMDEAEAWAKTRGIASVALYTQLHREDAEAFYLKRGYLEANRSRLMRKKL